MAALRGEQLAPQPSSSQGRARRVGALATEPLSKDALGFRARVFESPVPEGKGGRPSRSPAAPLLLLRGGLLAHGRQTLAANRVSCKCYGGERHDLQIKPVRLAQWKIKRGKEAMGFSEATGAGKRCHLPLPAILTP